MNVGRIVIAGNVKNSTIITGNKIPRKLDWIKNPFNDSLVCFVGGIKAQIVFEQSEGNYSFVISKENDGTTTQLAVGICSDLDKTKSMIDGYFYDMV